MLRPTLADTLRELRNPDTRTLVELLATHLGCTRGTWSIEFVLHDGHLQKTFMKHGPVKNDDLETRSARG